MFECFSVLFPYMEDFPMEKYGLLRPVCFLNDVEIGGSIGRHGKRLALALSWACMRRCGATKMLKIMLCEHDCACDVGRHLHSACPISVALFIQFFMQVQQHLSKLFDNLAKMKFQLDSKQKPTKVGLGMYSKEEEYISFSEPCDCSGQVRGKTLSVKTVQQSLLSCPTLDRWEKGLWPFSN